MAEEAQVVQDEVVIEENVDETPVVDETPEPSEAETSAMEQGWKPKDQFEGDVSKWVPADEFLRRGELFGKIDSLNRDLKDTRKVLKTLQEHHIKVKQAEYQHALQTLRAEKKQALADGDADALISIDERMADTKAQQISENNIAQQAAAAPDPRFVAWVNENPWYTKDPELRSFADETGLSYARLHGDADPTDVLKYVKERIKKAFPDKFVNPNRERPNTVEGSRVPAGKKREEEFVLTEDERRVMNTLIRGGHLTKEEYINDLKAIKGV